jgi:hypothetical protein
MATAAKKIIEQAKRLPARDRRRVVSALEASLNKVERTAKARHGATSYDTLLALAGTAHADVHDVSANKYAHVAAAYSDDA